MWESSTFTAGPEPGVKQRASEGQALDPVQWADLSLLSATVQKLELQTKGEGVVVSCRCLNSLWCISSFIDSRSALMGLDMSVDEQIGARYEEHRNNSRYGETTQN